MKLTRDSEGEVIGLDVLYPAPKHFEQVDREIRKLLVEPLTLGERIWGSMMRVSGPPLYTELELLVMATRKRCANAAVDELLKASMFITGKKPYSYVIPEITPLT